MTDEIAVYAIAENGEGRVIELKRTDWADEDEFDLPSLGKGWIYRIVRETKEE